MAQAMLATRLAARAAPASVASAGLLDSGQRLNVGGRATVNWTGGNDQSVVTVTLRIRAVLADFGIGRHVDFVRKAIMLRAAT